MVTDKVVDGVTTETNTGAVIMGGISGFASIGKDNTIALDGCSNNGALKVDPIDLEGNVKIGGSIAHIGSTFSLDILNGYTNSIGLPGFDIESDELY